MIPSDEFNRIFGIKESFELPDKLMTIIESKQERERLFDQFTEREKDLTYDWFTDYFQEGHANREALMQDFTPRSVTDILSGIAEDFQQCADICAGTGGLTIAMWNKNHDASFYCEELSLRALPLLIFNLAIRNMDAIIVNRDVLTMETKRIYKLSKGIRYSNIEPLHDVPKVTADVVVMNPPYSVKHKWDEKLRDRRFDVYGYPPNNFSDFAFVLHGLSMLSRSGQLIAILPHGVLFRGGKEEAIRKRLIEECLISAVIGLPEKLFLNTQIPVFLLVINKKKRDSILFVDAAKEYRGAGKQNIIDPAQVKKIVETYHKGIEVERFAHLTTPEELAYNDFNLNIPRYVDTSEPEPLVDVVGSVNEIRELDEKIKKAYKEIRDALNQMTATTEEAGQSLKELKEAWEDLANG